MNNSLTKYEPDFIKKARQAAGTSTPSSKVSYIKVSYENDATYGHYILKTFNPSTETYTDEDLGDKFEGTILVVSKKCGEWDGTNNKKKSESNEFFDYGQVITLVEGDTIKQGTYRELKNANENLVLQLVLYVLVKGKVYCVYIKGKTIFEFGDYEKLIKDNDSSIQQFKTIFSLSREKNGAVIYFQTHFTRGEENDLKSMYNLTLEVRNAINARQDRFFKKEVKEEIDEEDAGAEVVNVDDFDLPF